MTTGGRAETRFCSHLSSNSVVILIWVYVCSKRAVVQVTFLCLAKSAN